MPQNTENVRIAGACVRLILKSRTGTYAVGTEAGKLSNQIAILLLYEQNVPRAVTVDVGDLISKLFASHLVPFLDCHLTK